MSTVEPLKRF